MPEGASFDFPFEDKLRRAKKRHIQKQKRDSQRKRRTTNNGQHKQTQKRWKKTKTRRRNEDGHQSFAVADEWDTSSFVGKKKQKKKSHDERRCSSRQTPTCTRRRRVSLTRTRLIQDLSRARAFFRTLRRSERKWKDVVREWHVLSHVKQRVSQYTNVDILLLGIQFCTDHHFLKEKEFSFDDDPRETFVEHVMTFAQFFPTIDFLPLSFDISECVVCLLRQTLVSAAQHAFAEQKCFFHEGQYKTFFNMLLLCEDWIGNDLFGDLGICVSLLNGDEQPIYPLKSESGCELEVLDGKEMNEDRGIVRRCNRDKSCAISVVYWTLTMSNAARCDIFLDCIEDLDIMMTDVCSRLIFKVIQYPDAEKLKVLLKHGANPNVAPYSWSRNTPLHEASYLQRLEFVRILLEHGADPNKLNGCEETFLHIIVAGCVSSFHCLEEHRRLLWRTIEEYMICIDDLNARDRYGRTIRECLMRIGYQDKFDGALRRHAHSAHAALLACTSDGWARLPSDLVDVVVAMLFIV